MSVPWRLTPNGWRDPALVTARLAEGADANARLTGADTPLHEAVFEDAPNEVLEALLAHGAEVDARNTVNATPLWVAVRYGRRVAATVLLRAGADPWAPAECGRSPGRYALDGPLADLFRDLPGAPEITDAERTARQHADDLLHSYRWVWDWTTFLQDVTFVSGLTEDEAIRRLGADPDRCPAVRGPYHGMFDDEEPSILEDLDDEPRFFDVYLAARGDGVCLLGQAAATSRACRELSAGTRLATMFLCEAKGLCSVECWSEGAKRYETDPLDLAPNDLADGWLYRFGDHAHPSSYEARAFAFMTAYTGVSITDRWLLDGPMRGVDAPTE